MLVSTIYMHMISLRIPSLYILHRDSLKISHDRIQFCNREYDEELDQIDNELYLKGYLVIFIHIVTQIENMINMKGLKMIS